MQHITAVIALPWLSCRDRDGGDLWRVAIRADGRRQPDHATIAGVDHAAIARTIVLDHAGPAASRHASDRAIALAGTPVDAVSGRRARTPTGGEQELLIAAWSDAAARARGLGHAIVIAVDDDGLLHRAVSPLEGAPDPDLVLAIIAACAPCDLRLTVEDLAPGGLDATAGLAFARRAIAVAGATRVFAGGGTAAFDPLWSRRKGQSLDRSGLGLASAGWLVGRVDVPVHGVVRGDVDVDVVTARGLALGLEGIVQVESGGTDDDLSRAGRDGSR